jgi:hypothetical protein
MASDLVLLSRDEDTFALAVVEYGGNVGAAYRSVFGEDARNPGSKAREMLSRPEIAKRVAELQRAVSEDHLISLGAHLMKLAEIRDLAITLDQPKAALEAEKARGTVAGYYQGKEDPKGSGQGPSVHIHLGTSTPANANDWAEKFGSGAPVVIDMPGK